MPRDRLRMPSLPGERIDPKLSGPLRIRSQVALGHLKGCDDRFFMFIDDNLTQDRDYALRLFRAIAPLKKNCAWASAASCGAKNR